MNDLGSKVADNMLFVAEFAGLVFVIFLIAYLVEKRIHLKNHDTERILSTRKIALVGLFAAVSAVLMVLEVPVPFAPPFYKIDLSELPILIITFAFGPVAGVMTEFIKILLKLIAFCFELIHLLFYIGILLFSDGKTSYHIAKRCTDCSYKGACAAAARNRGFGAQYFHKFIAGNC